MHSFKINRIKSESPLIATFAIFGIIVSLFFYPKILWYSFLTFPILALAYLLLRQMELGLFRRKCFLILDEDGMKYCFHVFQQPKSLLWSQVEKVNYQLYEINLKLEASGHIISIQTSYLDNPDDLAQLKALINAKCLVA